MSLVHVECSGPISQGVESPVSEASSPSWTHGHVRWFVHMGPELLATKGDAAGGRFGPLLVVASLVCGVVAPVVACVCVVAFGLPMGHLFGMAALLATASLTWTLLGRRTRLAPFVVGVLAAGSILVGAGTSLASLVTLLLFEWNQPLTPPVSIMILFVVASGLATVAYAIQAGSAVRVLRPWRKSSRIGFVLGVGATLASLWVGEVAREAIDQHCANVIVAEGESGVPRIALWKPLAPCLRLSGVYDAYRHHTFVGSPDSRPDRSELQRAFRSFTGREMDDSF